MLLAARDRFGLIGGTRDGESNYDGYSDGDYFLTEGSTSNRKVSPLDNLNISEFFPIGKDNITSEIILQLLNRDSCSSLNTNFLMHLERRTRDNILSNQVRFNSFSHGYM